MIFATYQKHPKVKDVYQFGEMESLPKGAVQISLGTPGAGYDPMAMAQDMLETADFLVLFGGAPDNESKMRVEGYSLPK